MQPLTLPPLESGQLGSAQSWPGRGAGMDRQAAVKEGAVRAPVCPGRGQPGVTLHLSREQECVFRATSEAGSLLSF